MNDINEQTTTDDCALLDSIKRLTEVRLTSCYKGTWMQIMKILMK